MTEIYKFDYKIFNPIQDRVAGEGGGKKDLLPALPLQLLQK